MKLNLVVFFVFIYANAFSQVKGDSIATQIVDGKSYEAVYDSTGNLSIYGSEGKRVFFLNAKELYLEGFWRLKFQDFNGDGFKDIIVEYYSNVPDRNDLILYDPSTRKFIHVKNFSDYPAAIRLKGTNLFYSYHRSGCADQNWDSDLFKIVKFRIIKIGNISGQACVDSPDKPGIYIIKIKGRHELLIKKFPIDEPNNFKDSKWDFIAWYWKHNYMKFSQQRN